MLKNVSSGPVVLKWGGEHVTLLPGQICRYKEPRIELRQKAKHGAALEHTPEPKSAEESRSHVVIDPPKTADPSSPPADPTPPLGCNSCEFVAKTPQGLDTHIRSKHAS